MNWRNEDCDYPFVDGRKLYIPHPVYDKEGALKESWFSADIGRDEWVAVHIKWGTGVPDRWMFFSDGREVAWKDICNKGTLIRLFLRIYPVEFRVGAPWTDEDLAIMALEDLC